MTIKKQNEIINSLLEKCENAAVLIIEYRKQIDYLQKYLGKKKFKKLMKKYYEQTEGDAI